ncbi:hypothetical protein [Xanthocytophaga agilis]|uniref:Lipoprotein n=1 Tax=Xanthocytophaga agilis TaxID=3048010 RepID=A0AAE3R9F4_9BACT|nr:hypothetical protein [Xanthocytophaga agilis]MDJ1503935.1 hypothetical protein [Xanthocytophaga agilis]
MKKVVLAITLFISFLGYSCKDQLDRLLTFRINNESTCTIPGANLVNPVFNNIVPTPSITSNSSQTFENEGTNANLVKNIVLEKLKLTITSPSDADFRFIESIKIYIKADGLPKVLIASKISIPTNIGKELELDPTQEKLDEYIKKSNYTLENEVVTRSAPWPEMELKINTTFKVTADPL